ncbi:MAG TPA: F0F1 ATP synthase subunit epsilon [Terriglobales bacterium]|jgi:F-type H+-transporting ATPase subunit epsilon|nr:F0F1 ATP synthase subunit epsilon [Terriglobales bacterium]
MPDTFQLEIVTPTRLLVKDAAEEAQIPGATGYLGILPGHAPLITELGVGEITYKASGTTHTLAVAWGFAEVLPDKLTILAEAAERPQEIDIARAQKAKERAEERLKSNAADVDYARAEDALRRAESRLDVAKEKK